MRTYNPEFEEFHGLGKVRPDILAGIFAQAINRKSDEELATDLLCRKIEGRTKSPYTRALMYAAKKRGLAEP